MIFNTEIDTEFILTVIGFIFAVILVIIAVFTLVFRFLNHIKGDRNERRRIQEIYCDIENLIYYFYQKEIVNDVVNKFEDLFKQYDQKRILPKTLEYCSDEHIYYKLKVEQNIQYYKNFLGLVVTGKKNKREYLNDAYIIMKNTGELVKRSGEKIIQDYAHIKDEEIEQVDNFLTRLKNYWNTHYWKRFAGKIKKKKDPKKDLKYFIEEIEKKIEPMSLFQYFLKGNLLHYKGENEKAIEMYDKALIINPTNILVLNNKGMAFIDLKEYDKAIELFDEVLSIKSNWYSALNNKGYAFYHLKEYKKAIEWYDKAIAIDSESYTALNNKGKALHYLEEYEKAIELFDRAIAIDPKQAKPIYNKACTESIRDNRVETIDLLEKAINLDDNLKKLAKEEKDFDKIREEEEFKRLIEN